MCQTQSASSARLAAAAVLLALSACALPRLAGDALLPTGVLVTPLAAPGAQYEQLDPGLASSPGLRAGQPATLAVSPDGAQLLTLTSGFNKAAGPGGEILKEASTEWIFVHRLGEGPPRREQAIPIANTFLGLAWAPDGSRFYASGGVDDSVHEYARGAGGFAEVLPPIALGHAAGLGVEVRPLAAGLALDPAGGRLLIADYENDAVTVVDLAKRAAVAELDLRPGRSDPARRGQPGGAFPVAVAFTAPGEAWVACARDREVVAVELRGAAPRVVARVPVGEQPFALLAAGGRLYVANSGSDTVSVVDPAARAVVEVLPVVAGGLGGSAGANALALSADGRTLYVALGGLNAVAALPLSKDGGEAALLPTGWYPDAVAVDARGGRLIVANARSPSGPNPGACRDSTSIVPAAGPAAGGDKAKLAPGGCRSRNQYVWQLVKGGLLSFPSPGPAEARRLTGQVIANARLEAQVDPRAQELFAFLRTRIKHVIYVVKENRSYDQILGDLPGGDGDPRLNLFPERVTPSHHALARQFVLLDRFFVSGNSSGDGWNWSTAARTSHVTEQLEPVQYAGRGGSYDYEGQNRNINLSLPTAERRAASPLVADDDDLLPGPADVARPGGESGTGYLWSAAIRAGLSLRNYGFFGDDTLYDPKKPGFLPPSRAAFAERARQFIANEQELRDRSDPWFRTFDMRFPDYWNFKEWEREFDEGALRGELPRLSLVRLAHDHFGGFKEALDGVDTPDTQMADNDYALGLLVAKVSKSRWAGETVIIAVEDDAQDGPDHVDSHRSFLLVAGAHVRQGAVSSRAATTVDVLRTIEELLGLAPLSHTDRSARPLDELFTREERPWAFEAKVPAVLRTTRLPLPPAAPGEVAELPRGDAAAWERAAQGQDFSTADALDAAAFNRALAELLGQR